MGLRAAIRGDPPPGRSSEPSLHLSWRSASAQAKCPRRPNSWSAASWTGTAGAAWVRSTWAGHAGGIPSTFSMLAGYLQIEEGDQAPDVVFARGADTAQNQETSWSPRAETRFGLLGPGWRGFSSAEFVN